MNKKIDSNKSIIDKYFKLSIKKIDMSYKKK